MAYKPSEIRKVRKPDVLGPNLVPMMNLFIVIIPMLITMVVSVNLAMIEIAIPTAQESAGDGGNGNEGIGGGGIDNLIRVTILQEKFLISVDNKTIKEIPVIANEGVIKYDYVELDNQISILKERYKQQDMVEILPDATILFDTLLRSIDICKFNGFPNITYLTAETKVFKVNK